VSHVWAAASGAVWPRTIGGKRRPGAMEVDRHSQVRHRVGLRREQTLSSWWFEDERDPTGWQQGNSRTRHSHSQNAAARGERV
jgi:hypothetical protein